MLIQYRSPTDEEWDRIVSLCLVMKKHMPICIYDTSIHIGHWSIYKKCSEATIYEGVSFTPPDKIISCVKMNILVVRDILNASIPGMFDKYTRLQSLGIVLRYAKYQNMVLEDRVIYSKNNRDTLTVTLESDIDSVLKDLIPIVLKRT